MSVVYGMPGIRLYTRRYTYAALAASGIGSLLITYQASLYTVVTGVVLFLLSMAYYVKYVDYVKSLREAAVLVLLLVVAVSLGGLLGYVLSGSYYSLSTCATLALASFVTAIASLRLYPR
ncbi:hypothetical protein [Thermogladius calderae]|uniref:hypothetical protein n=1 Tax=Thermogladius calderae TaxID=1200300 RepID=UPI001EE679AC|nr:hypothetical protein [Thermogladius calderae]